MQKRKFFIGIIFIIFGVYIDRYTKILAFNHINELIIKTNNPNATYNIFTGFDIVLVFNKGVAFGIFNNAFFEKFMPPILLIITIIIVCGILYYFWKDNDNTVTYVLLAAGGLGNILDRLTVGAVIDFIDIYIGKYHWPAFNLADSFVCCGVLFYILFSQPKITKQD